MALSASGTVTNNINISVGEAKEITVDTFPQKFIAVGEVTSIHSDSSKWFLDRGGILYSSDTVNKYTGMGYVNKSNTGRIDGYGVNFHLFAAKAPYNCTIMSSSGNINNAMNPNGNCFFVMSEDYWNRLLSHQWCFTIEAGALAYNSYKSYSGRIGYPPTYINSPSSAGSTISEGDYIVC